MSNTLKPRRETMQNVKKKQKIRKKFGYIKKKHYLCAKFLSFLTNIYTKIWKLK